MSKAFISKITDNLPEQLQAGLEYIDWKSIIYPGSRVFIKPNLTWYEPRPGVTTSPEFIDALLGILKTQTNHIYVGESNGGTFLADQAFETHGLPAVCEKHSARLINLSNQPATMLDDVIAGRPIRIEASRFLLEDVDVFISLPLLKTHVVTKVTLGMKNQWGCIPDPMRLLYHHILDWGIVALNRAYKPRITILDAAYAMDRRGPLEGDAIPVNWLALSDNIVTLDAIGCHLLGLDPAFVRHLRFAEQEGLGSLDLQHVQLNQPLPEPLIQATIQPNLMDWIAIILYRSWLLSKLAFDSPLTPLMYKIIGRTPPGVLPAKA